MDEGNMYEAIMFGTIAAVTAIELTVGSLRELPGMVMDYVRHQGPRDFRHGAAAIRGEPQHRIIEGSTKSDIPGYRRVMPVEIFRDYDGIVQHRNLPDRLEKIE
jgi:hypothetical protein